MDNVWVVVATNDDGFIKECIVMRDKDKAWNVYKTVCKIYGSKNSAFISRAIDTVPMNILASQKSG